MPLVIYRAVAELYTKVRCCPCLGFGEQVASWISVPLILGQHRVQSLRFAVDINSSFTLQSEKGTMSTAVYRQVSSTQSTTARWCQCAQDTDKWDTPDSAVVVYNMSLIFIGSSSSFLIFS